MMTTSASSSPAAIETNSGKSILDVISFESMKLSGEGRVRERSISCGMTAATAEDSESLTDEETENSKQGDSITEGGTAEELDSRVQQDDVVNDDQEASVAVAEAHDESLSFSDDLSPPTPDHSSPSNEEEEVPVMQEEGKKDEPPRRRRSILKPTDMEIPVKNRGWKNLPKADLSKASPVVVAATRTSACPTKRRQVSFLNVEIRCYDQCVGDNPAVSYGTPISLDWNFEEMAPLELDVYESARVGNRRNPRQMMMNYYNRRHVLTLSCGVTEDELLKAEKAANKIRSQRALTRALLPASKVEDFFSSGLRKTKRALNNKKSKSLSQS